MIFDDILRMPKGEPKISALRSRTMAAVRSKDTKPELSLRKSLRRLGLRFSTYAKDLPGTPDIVFVRAKVAVFCDGDFWHGRKWKARKAAGQFEVRRSYWIAKIEGNMARDRRVNAKLRRRGWRVVRIWNSDIDKKPGEVAAKVLQLVQRTAVAT